MTLFVLEPNILEINSYKKFIIEYLQDSQKYYTILRDHYIYSNMDIDALIAYQKMCASGSPPQGHYPFSTIWIKYDCDIVAEGVLRHDIPEHVKQFAGHITYYVLPSKRGHGYGKMLYSALCHEAKKLNMKYIIVCVDKKNIPSKKIIENSSAKQIDVVDNILKYNEITIRYLVEL